MHAPVLFWVLILFDKVLKSLRLSQSVRANWKICLRCLFWYWIFTSKSMIMMSWSDIPGTDTECVTIVEFVVKTSSNNLLF